MNLPHTRLTAYTVGTGTTAFNENEFLDRATLVTHCFEFIALQLFDIDMADNLALATNVMQRIVPTSSASAPLPPPLDS